MHNRLVASIVLPCRDEETFIAACLDSIVVNDFPKDRLEVLVVDGISEDRTRRIVERYAQRYGWIRLMDNPHKITPAALNIGIKAAKGQIILRMDAHATYAPDYISKCVQGLEKYQADNVGGIMITVPREESLVGTGIAVALSYRFGVGSSHFRIRPRELKKVDTVFGGCYKKEVFDRIGLFNEALSRGQDLEFNLRLKKAGGKILLIPNIVSQYYARSDLRSFWSHNWSNGVWAILPFLYSPVMPVSWRHLVPLLFVVSFIGSAVLGIMLPSFLSLGLVIAGAYICATVAASLHIAWKQWDVRYVAVMPLLFGMLHVGYGLGSLWGVIKVVIAPGFWKKLAGKGGLCLEQS